MENTIILSGYAKKIALALHCDAQTAEKIFNKLCEIDFDFSRSSKVAFNKAIKFALLEINN